MKSFALTIIIFALLPNSVFAQADARDKKPELASLKWLAGSWHGIEGNQLTEEQWMRSEIRRTRLDDLTGCYLFMVEVNHSLMPKAVAE